MPALANVRHERFAQAIFEGMAKGQAYQGRAYKAAGYQVTNGNSARSCASRLLTFANGVAERIIELQAQAKSRHDVTIDSIRDELDDAREVAREASQANAMVAATTTKAKLYGLFVERTEQGKPGDFSQVTSLDEIADSLLMTANPELASNRQAVSEGMRGLALSELARHAANIQAIAHGAVLIDGD